MSKALVHLLADGEQALAANEWDTARASFEAALQIEESGEALDGLAWVRFWHQDYASAIEFRERAFAEFERQGRPLQAGMIACWLCFLYSAVHGNEAAARGWYARAEDLIGGQGDCAELGWLTLLRSGMLPDLEQRKRAAFEALEIGRRFGDRDLKFEALSYAGEALVTLGEIDRGMSCLDEAMAAVTGGEVRGPMTAKKTANLTDTGGQPRPLLESEGLRSNSGGPVWTSMHGKPAVFKTVCGALLRRPGWVRFPSVPAIRGAFDTELTLG